MDMTYTVQTIVKTYQFTTLELGLLFISFILFMFILMIVLVVLFYIAIKIMKLEKYFHFKVDKEFKKKVKK